jgi:hypothetical protein
MIQGHVWEHPTSRIPTWLHLLFGVRAAVSAVLGVIGAPAGVPNSFCVSITVLGVTSLVFVGTRSSTAAPTGT